MNSIIKNSVYKLILNVFNLGIPLIIGPYALRVLGPDVMGNIYYNETIYSYFMIISSFGLYQYGIRELSIIRDNSKKTKELFSSLLIISIVATFLTFVIYWINMILNFKGTSNFNILAVYSINIITNALFVEWALEAQENYKFITIKTIVIKVIYVILLIGFVRNKNDGIIYVGLFVLSTSLNNIVSYIYIHHNIGFSIKNIKISCHILPLLLVVLMANINTFFTQFDRLVLGAFTNNDMVAYYVLPQSISGTINSLLMSFTAVLIPRLSNILNNFGREEYLKMLRITFKEFIYILLPISIGLFVVSDKVIVLYGGIQYVNSISTMKVFSIYLFTLGLEFIFTNQIIYLFQGERILIKIITSAAITNLLLDLILVKFKILSSLTAIITTLIANLLIIILSYIYIRKKLNIKLEVIDKNFFRALLISTSFFIINYLCERICRSIFIQLIFVVLLSGIIYFIFYINIDTYASKRIVQFLKLRIFRQK